MRAFSTVQARPVQGCETGRSRGHGAMARSGAHGGLSPRPGLGATARRVQVELSPVAVEAVAQRIAQLLGDRDAQRQPELLTAGELARELRVERSWVYKHTHLLGGERIGDGPKAQWRFDLKTAKAALARQRAARGIGGGV